MHTAKNDVCTIVDLWADFSNGPVPEHELDDSRGVVAIEIRPLSARRAIRFGETGKGGQESAADPCKGSMGRGAIENLAAAHRFAEHQRIARSVGDIRQSRLSARPENPFVVA